MKIYRVIDDGTCVLTTGDLAKVGAKLVELSVKCDIPTPFWVDEDEVQ